MTPHFRTSVRTPERAGDTWIVVAIVNHDDAAKGRPVLDALIEWVARSGARWRP